MTNYRLIGEHDTRCTWDEFFRDDNQEEENDCPGCGFGGGDLCVTCEPHYANGGGAELEKLADLLDMTVERMSRNHGRAPCIMVEGIDRSTRPVMDTGDYYVGWEPNGYWYGPDYNRAIFRHMPLEVIADLLNKYGGMR